MNTQISLPLDNQGLLNASGSTDSNGNNNNNLPDANYVRFNHLIADLRFCTSEIRNHLLLLSRRTESSWRRQVINQSTEISAMVKLEDVQAKIERIENDLDEKETLVDITDQIIADAENEFGQRLNDCLELLKGACKESGFFNLKKGLKIILGDNWKSQFPPDGIKAIEDYNKIFTPIGYAIAKIDYKLTDRICTLVLDDELRIAEKRRTVKKQIPYFTKNRVFSKLSALELVHGAELNIPYKNSKGKPEILVVRGYFLNDPINIGSTLDMITSKKREVEAFIKDLPYSESYKNGYLKQYPLRDLIVNDSSEILKEMEKDWKLLEKLSKKQAMPSIAKEFENSDFIQQVRVMSVLLMMDSIELAVFLWDLTFKRVPEYQHIIRNTLHYSLQKKLGLATEELEVTKEKLKKINEYKVPYETRIAQSKMDDEVKIKALEKLKSSKKTGGEADKDAKYLDGLLKIPFGRYTTEPVTKDSSPEEIRAYLDKIAVDLDHATYGQLKPKRSVITWVAQRISNGESKGECIALEGPPGVGKTTLAKEGIAKALGRPFVFISLSGKSDASYLVGHGQTYVGSTWGRIVDSLMTAERMDPVIFIDEVDKISKTESGRELVGVLTALTDFTQNKQFQDQYFSGINFDLSRALFVFSYNDPEDIDPIFKDRLTIFKIQELSIREKIVIAQKFLMPEILKSTGFKPGEITIDEDHLKFMIENYTFEAGARKLKENLFAIVRELNVERLREPGSLKFPYKIDKDTIIKFRDVPRMETDKITAEPVIGMVNGLYATNAGIGGLTLIQTYRTIAKKPLELTLTGRMGQVMQESMSVAKTIAWNLIPEDVKKKIHEGEPEGLHIHCPSGGTPKDGPSAGGAITTAIVSQLMGIPVRNDVAMTGEIEFSGKITPIGGLSAKLHGAKKAGIKLALVPRGNEKDYKKIVLNNPDLIDDTFKVEIVDTIHDILDHALVNNPIKRSK